MVSLGVRCLSRRLHVGSWKPWAAARGPGGCTWPSLCVPGCHHAVTLPTGPHRTIGEDPPPGPEDGLGSKRRAGTWWGPCGTPCLPRSGFLCAKQPSVWLTSATLLEICPQLSSPPGGVGALLYSFIFPVPAFFALRSSGPAGASAFVSLYRPCHQQSVSFFHAFLSHLDSAAFCVSFCDTLMS